jgi:DNA repair protein RadC
MGNCYVPIYRLKLVREGSLPMPAPRPKAASSDDAFDICKEYLADAANETLIVLLLDRRLAIIGVATVSTGSTYSIATQVAQVFRLALLHNAPGIIACHNHPSGDPTPSDEDISFTRALEAAGDLLDVQLVDHIVIAHEPPFGWQYRSIKASAEWQGRVAKFTPKRKECKA